APSAKKRQDPEEREDLGAGQSAPFYGEGGGSGGPDDDRTGSGGIRITASSGGIVGADPIEARPRGRRILVGLDIRSDHRNLGEGNPVDAALDLESELVRGVVAPGEIDPPRPRGYRDQQAGGHRQIGIEVERGDEMAARRAVPGRKRAAEVPVE